MFWFCLHERIFQLAKIIGLICLAYISLCTELSKNYLNQGNVHICQTSFYEDLYSQLMHAQQSSYCISIFILYTLHCIWTSNATTQFITLQICTKYYNQLEINGKIYRKTYIDVSTYENE